MTMQSYVLANPPLAPSVRLQIKGIARENAFKIESCGVPLRGCSIWFFPNEIYMHVLSFIYTVDDPSVEPYPITTFIAYLQKSVLQFRAATTFQFIYYGKLNICFVKTKNIFFKETISQKKKKKALREKMPSKFYKSMLGNVLCGVHVYCINWTQDGGLPGL